MKHLLIGSLLLPVSITVAAMAPRAESQLQFFSSDTVLQSTFDLAKTRAMHYSHADGDPVGPWYMAALPEREAFCIRDLSHQAIGAHLLGLDSQNVNMMTKFVSAIADSRDWCSYWEIDRFDRPVPVDYKSDKEFWYNLNANPDLIVASLKLYNWTADDRYILSPEFTNFFNRTLNDYVDRWQLSPDSIMSRPRFMNRDPEIQRGTPYYACRGIPSYTEGVRGLSVGIDLVAALAAGHREAAAISRLNPGITIHSDTLLQRSRRYTELIDSLWWDTKSNRYYAFFTESGEFAHGEGPMFTLWYDVLKSPERRGACLDQITSRTWNIENMSYQPALLLDMGYPAEAYRLIAELPSMPRNDYPELSFALIEAIVRAAMGIVPDATDHTLSTEYRMTNIDATLTVESVPLFGGTIDLTHDGMRSSTFTNHTPVTITWTPKINGTSLPALTVLPGTTATATPSR